MGLSGHVKGTAAMRLEEPSAETGLHKLEYCLLDYSSRHRLDSINRICLEGRDVLIPDCGALPLRVVSAALWSSVRNDCTEHYDRVLDFVNTIWEQAAGLVMYRHYLKLCMAFKAKLLMEMFVKRRNLLDILWTLEQYFPKTVAADPQADELEEEFGSSFMASTRRLLWEFLERLESILPEPRIDQLLAAGVNVGSLSLTEQSLLSVLASTPMPVSDVLLMLMQRLREQQSEDLTNVNWSNSETLFGVPMTSSSTHTVLSEGYCIEAEQITVEPQVKGEGNNSQPPSRNMKHQEERKQKVAEQWLEISHPEMADEVEETVNRTEIGGEYTGIGMRLYSLRNGQGAAMERKDNREHPSPLAQSQRVAFSAFHFDQSCDEEFEDCMRKLSPPNPLQSQVNSTSPVPVCPSIQTQANESQPQPISPRRLGLNADLCAGESDSSTSSPGQARCGNLPGSGSLSLNQPGQNTIDLKALTAAPISLEAQSSLLHSPLFQPQVILFRLTADQNARSSVPNTWSLQRNSLSGGRDHCQLSEGDNCTGHNSKQNPHTLPWFLRKRPQRAPSDRMPLYNSSSGSLFSSEESSQSDNSDSEYLPYYSQVKRPSRWNRYQKRNSVRQIIGAT
ncbi:uncharacterized protein LOC125459665 isoform X2 [Stegostoma tigrinum]|uniref:uncharacterized protein LOC125459665 isoform X2 n=1 Tax=Stegostoma tigrinum TaxID=3053191 RepID=UPI00202B24D0|nr:uncharacterized protein LOC125459665 isoform X2 [Stegostoma tigrinum]